MRITFGVQPRFSAQKQQRSKCAEAIDRAQLEGEPLAISLTGAFAAVTGASAGLVAASFGAGAIVLSSMWGLCGGLILGTLVTRALLLPSLVPLLEQRARRICGET